MQPYTFMAVREGMENANWKIQIQIFIVMHYLQNITKSTFTEITYMKYKKKEVKQYITRKIVLSDQSTH